MAEFPNPNWISELPGSGHAPGPSLAVQLVVTGGPGGDAKVYLRFDDGVVTEASVGTAPAPDVTLTATAPDAAAMAAGELDPSVAFMQGRMKTAGDPGLLLDLLAHVRGWVKRAGDRGGRASR
ncbi:MAG: SCP2 sterol-binding domain-containing protein [Acidimicrobiia bacterium]